MPFNGPDDDKLPSNVQGLSLAKRRRWVGAWNGRFEQCREDGGNTDDCESSAFAVANASVKEMDMEEQAKEHGLKDGMEVWDLMERQVSQEEAAYTTDGGLNGDPCAACRWFVAPGGCLIVANWPEPILPTGSSNRFERKVVMEPDPMPVVIVEEGESDFSPIGEKQDMPTPPHPSTDTGVTITEGAVDFKLKIPSSWKDKFKSGLDTLIASFKSDDAPQSDLILFNDKDGRLRWFMVASNKYRDRDDPPEIFAEAAHKEFVRYLDEGGAYPEAWLWHTPGTRWGVADWADYADGFLMYSGTVDEGMEHVAQSLAQTKGLGVSHGYEFRYSDKERGIIGWYRDFEVSPLPHERAANLWTGIEILAKEMEMGFSEAKRNFLVSHLGEDKVKDLEGNTEQLRKEIEALGIEWKDVPDADADAPTPEEGDGGIDYARIAQESVKAMSESEGFKALGEKMDGFDGRLTQLEADVKALKESDDEKIAAKIAPRNDPTQYHRPSQDDGNVVNGAGGKNADGYLEKRGPVAKEFGESLFGAQPVEGEAERTPA